MIVREGELGDVAQISAFLKELTAIGKRTRPDDEHFVRAHYIEAPNGVRCSVAVEDGVVLGFQSLTRAEAGNEWGVTPGWGIIGTHIKASAARKGVGRALFKASRAAAERAGIEKIDASIGADNAEGLGYYDAMGFVTYREPEGKVCKVFDVAGVGS